MGSWTLTIKGAGMHHSQDPQNHPLDIDKLAPTIVQQLKDAGQFLSAGSLEVDGHEPQELA